jgi:uncharacterized repeat protein (TIGR01451 family)
MTVGAYTYRLVHDADGNWYLRNPPPVVSIAKSSANTQAIPGQQVTYTVTVTNPGPSTIDSTTVSDPIPVGLNTVTWACQSGACGSASSSGALSDTLTNFIGGATAVYTITGTVDSAASGDIVNTAAVTQPTGGSCDPACTAKVTLPVAALVSITKTSAVTQAVPGEVVEYTVTVTNVGQVAAHGTAVSDPAPAGLDNVSWICTPSGGATCTASGSGNLTDTLTSLPGGGVAAYTVTGTVLFTATGNIDNTATITPPATAVCDPATTCAASVTLPVVAVVRITKEVIEKQAVPGATVHYKVIVTNPGAVAADGATVADSIPTGLTTPFTWTCMPSPGAACTASGSGDLQDTLTAFPGGASAAYEITATVAGTATGIIKNTAMATPPGLNRSGNIADAVLPVWAPGLATPVPALSEQRLLAYMLVMAGIGAAALDRRPAR